MQINKGDLIEFSVDKTVKALKPFSLKDAFSDFSSAYGWVEETMTKSSSTVLLDQFYGWLIKNGYITESKKAVVYININDLKDDNVTFTAFYYRNGNREELEIPLRSTVEEQGRYSASYQWSIDWVNFKTN